MFFLVGTGVVISDPDLFLVGMQGQNTEQMNGEELLPYMPMYN